MQFTKILSFNPISKMTVVNSCSVPIYRNAKYPGSLTPFAAEICRQNSPFTQIASLLYYIENTDTHNIQMM